MSSFDWILILTRYAWLAGFCGSTSVAVGAVPPFLADLAADGFLTGRDATYTPARIELSPMRRPPHSPLLTASVLSCLELLVLAKVVPSFLPWTRGVVASSVRVNGRSSGGTRMDGRSSDAAIRGDKELTSLVREHSTRASGPGKAENEWDSWTKEWPDEKKIDKKRSRNFISLLRDN